jgi:hypothetical protein
MSWPPESADCSVGSATDRVQNVNETKGPAVNTIAKWVAVFTLLACPIAANAQAVTYDFTGTIITGPGPNLYVTGPPTGFYAGDTGTVSGTYTFDFAYNNPALASGAFSTATGGNVENDTGTNPNIVTPQTAPGNVFSSTLVGTSAGDVGLSYSTTLATFWSNSSVEANPLSSWTGSPQYDASEGNSQTALSGTESALLIVGPVQGYPNPLGFSSSGLPVFVSGLSYAGVVASSDGPSELYFAITSLTPAAMAAPEIDPGTAASALTLLAGFVAMMRGRRLVAA